MAGVYRLVHLGAEAETLKNEKRAASCGKMQGPPFLQGGYVQAAARRDPIRKKSVASKKLKGALKKEAKYKPL